VQVAVRHGALRFSVQKCTTQQLTEQGLGIRDASLNLVLPRECLALNRGVCLCRAEEAACDPERLEAGTPVRIEIEDLGYKKNCRVPSEIVLFSDDVLCWVVGLDVAGGFWKLTGRA
jgi:hypothetical protein